MLDQLDYQEYKAVGGRSGRVPIERVISLLDAHFAKNDLAGAGRLLEYWQAEAVAVGDRSAQLTIEGELIGYYRKTDCKEKAYAAIDRALSLVGELHLEDSVSGATTYLNCATDLKAFGEPEKAIPLYRRAEELYLRLLSPEDVRFGGLYNNMALALTDLGMYEDALDRYRRALDVMEALPGGQADAAITYVNMAHLYERMGRTEDIDVAMLTAYSLLKDESLEKGGYYAFVCEKCYPSFAHFGFGAPARELARLSEEIYARS